MVRSDEEEIYLYKVPALAELERRLVDLQERAGHVLDAHAEDFAIELRDMRERGVLSAAEWRDWSELLSAAFAHASEHV